MQKGDQYDSSYSVTQINLVEIAVQLKSMPKAFSQVQGNTDFDSSIRVGLDLLRIIERLRESK